MVQTEQQNMRKKRFTVIGNCQGPFVAQALMQKPNFADRYELQHTPAVHVIEKSEIKAHVSRLKDLDLVVHQPILNADRFGGFETNTLRGVLQGRVPLICMPSVYFDGYFPTLSTISGLTTPAGLVHDMAAFHAFDLGWGAQKTERALYEGDIFGTAFYKAAFEQALLGLTQRETDAGVDVRVSDFLGTFGRGEILMHQFNHPTSTVFDEMARRICACLGLSVTPSETRQELDTVIWPVWPWVRAALSVEGQTPLSGGSDVLRFRGQTVSMSDYISGAFQAYAQMADAQRAGCRLRTPELRAVLAAT